MRYEGCQWPCGWTLDRQTHASRWDRGGETRVMVTKEQPRICRQTQVRFLDHSKTSSFAVEPRLHNPMQYRFENSQRSASKWSCLCFRGIVGTRRLARVSAALFEQMDVFAELSHIAHVSDHSFPMTPRATHPKRPPKNWPSNTVPEKKSCPPNNNTTEHEGFEVDRVFLVALGLIGHLFGQLCRSLAPSLPAAPLSAHTILCANICFANFAVGQSCVWDLSEKNVWQTPSFKGLPVFRIFA